MYTKFELHTTPTSLQCACPQCRHLKSKMEVAKSKMTGLLHFPRPQGHPRTWVAITRELSPHIVLLPW